MEQIVVKPNCDGFYAEYLARKTDFDARFEAEKEEAISLVAEKFAKESEILDSIHDAITEVIEIEELVEEQIAEEVQAEEQVGLVI